MHIINIQEKERACSISQTCVTMRNFVRENPANSLFHKNAPIGNGRFQHLKAGNDSIMCSVNSTLFSRNTKNYVSCDFKIQGNSEEALQKEVTSFDLTTDFLVFLQFSNPVGLV